MLNCNKFIWSKIEYLKSLNFFLKNILTVFKKTQPSTFNVKSLNFPKKIQPFNKKHSM